MYWILKRFDFQSLKMLLFIVKFIFEQMKCPTCQSMNQPWSHMMMQNLKCLEVLGWKPLFDHKIQEIEHRLSNMEKTVAKHAKFLHFLCKKTLVASQWEWDVIKSLSELRKNHNGNLCLGVERTFLSFWKVRPLSLVIAFLSRTQVSVLFLMLRDCMPPLKRIAELSQQ